MVKVSLPVKWDYIDANDISTEAENTITSCKRMKAILTYADIGAAAATLRMVTDTQDRVCITQRGEGLSSRLNNRNSRCVRMVGSWDHEHPR